MDKQNNIQSGVDQRPKKSIWRSSRWVLLALVILALAAVIFKFKSSTSSSVGESENPSQFIQADWIDLDRIASISKFRSGSGHDFSQGTGETCRSMKHYFNVPHTEEGERLGRQNNFLPPAPDGKTDIKIYSPVDGKIVRIEKEQTTGQQIYIEPSNAPEYTVRLFHIYKLDGIKKGSKVIAGQQIGVIGQYQNTDIAIEHRKGLNPNFMSYFEVLPDYIFTKYQARGIKDRSELIYTKEYRDSHPLECNGEQFAKNSDSDPESGNFVYLSGYK